jgi:hypothetical protein
MYKLLRIVSLVLFAGGFMIFPLMPGLWVFFLPFVGMVGYLVAKVLEPSSKLWGEPWEDDDVMQWDDTKD